MNKSDGGHSRQTMTQETAKNELDDPGPRIMLSAA
jgi:hypothetical protein